MDSSVTGMKGFKPGSILSGSEMVMVLFPFWIVLYYFRTDISGWLTNRILSVQPGTAASETLVFFISTLLKVFLLLLLIMFIMGFIRTWLPMAKIRKQLTRLPQLAGNGLAGLLGVVAPFCSCSAIPVFISFLEAGVPLGITFSFLIASPLVNEIILVMLFSLFGWRIAVAYLIAGLTIAVVSGFVIDKLKLEKYLPLWMLDFRNAREGDKPAGNIDERVVASVTSVREVLSRTWVFIIAGVLIGSAIHGYVPDTFLSDITDKNRWFSLPLLVLTGIPLYSCSAAIAPVAFALVAKGMPLGSALAFIMAVAGLSLPEFVMLRKVLSARLLLIFIGIVFAGIIVTGYLFNAIL